MKTILKKYWPLLAVLIVMFFMAINHKPDLYVWEGTVDVPTLDYNPLQALGELPRYCRKPKTGSWDTYLNYTLIDSGEWHHLDDVAGQWHTMEYIDYDSRSAKIDGFRKHFGFTTNYLGQIVIWDESSFPSDIIHSAFQQKVLEQNFRLRYLMVRLNGYNPKSMISTMYIKCVVVKNR